MNQFIFMWKKGNAEGKLWLEPMTEIAYMHHFTNKEIGAIIEITENNSDNFKKKWNEYFSKQI